MENHVDCIDMLENKGKEILFSILIPAYKVNYLKECIDSILSQSYENFEIIIVDDASPYDIWSVVSQYDDNRIHYYRNEIGFGAYNVVGNWNKCLEYASGDYVICMGDDDMLTPSCLADYIDIIEKYPGLNVYHTRTVLIDDQSVICNIQEQRPEYETGYSLWWHRWDNRNKQYIGDFLYLRIHLVNQGGFYFLPLAWASDDITAVRAALPYGIANVSVIGFKYRVSRMTISSKSSERSKAKAIELEKDWYKNELDCGHPSTPNDIVIFSILKSIFADHFKPKYLHCMNRDIGKSIFSSMYWLKMRKKYGITKLEVFLAIIRSFLYKTV